MLASLREEAAVIVKHPQVGAVGTFPLTDVPRRKGKNQLVVNLQFGQSQLKCSKLVGIEAVVKLHTVVRLDALDHKLIEPNHFFED